MNHADIPLLEFDPSRTASIEPGDIHARADVPEHAVLCFFDDVIDTVCRRRGAREVARIRWEFGTHPIYEIQCSGSRLAVLHPGVGAPLAAGFLEEAIALGCRRFIACGGAGALIAELAPGHPVIPSSAVRDEGTSYHYLPASREVAADPAGVAALEQTLGRARTPYLVGKTWTTDGLYRETPARVDRRRAEGCVTVEMEAAALMAVARFRSVPFGQLLYAGDSLAGAGWEHRSWQRMTAVRERMFRLAAEACLLL